MNDVSASTPRECSQNLSMASSASLSVAKSRNELKSGEALTIDVVLPESSYLVLIAKGTS
jgi:hypothetical protein